MYLKSCKCKPYIVESTKDGFIATKRDTTSEGGRETEMVHGHLEGVNKQPWVLQKVKGFKNTLCLFTHSGHTSNRTSVSPRASSSSEGGTSVLTKQAHKGTHKTLSEWIHITGKLILYPHRRPIILFVDLYLFCEKSDLF